MYFALTLSLLLIAPLSSASFFSSSSYNHDASQRPLQRTANQSPHLYSLPSWYYGRCPWPSQWCCNYASHTIFGGSWGVYCGCCGLGRRPEASDGLSYTDVTARNLAEIQNVTTLTVLTEVQPGNNHTLVSLFQVHCDKGRQHVACTQTDNGFACGCYDNWDTSCIVTKEYGGPDIGDDYKDEGLKNGNGEAATREVPKHESSEEVSDSQGSDVEVDRQGNNSYFSFQLHYWPLCMPGWYWRCSLISCIIRCYCVRYEVA